MFARAGAAAIVIVATTAAEIRSILAACTGGLLVARMAMVGPGGEISHQTFVQRPGKRRVLGSASHDRRRSRARPCAVRWPRAPSGQGRRAGQAAGAREIGRA